MQSITPDPDLHRYATRTQGMAASEIRALFAVASRPEIISLAGGMPDISVLDFEAVEQVTTEVLRTNGATALQYGGGQGSLALREALVGVMAAENVPAHAEDIVVTAGGQQGLDLVTKLFCDPGDIVVAEGPTYVGALGAFSAYQTDVRHVPMDARRDDPRGPRRAGRAPGARKVASAKLLYVIPNRQNPAGVSLAQARRHAIVEIADRHDLLILEDNPYGLLDFTGEARVPLIALAPHRVAYVGTLSKIFSPGLRVGWVVAHQQVRERLILLKEAADLCQSNFTQAVAETWLRTQPWLDQVKAYRELYHSAATH